jgi:hypothetical protein
MMSGRGHKQAPPFEDETQQETQQDAYSIDDEPLFGNDGAPTLEFAHYVDP